MTANQDTRGFLPPNTTTNDLRHQSPSSTTTRNLPHQPSGFTVLPLPPKLPPTTEEETQVLAAALAHAIIQFRDAVTTTIGNTHKNRSKSDANSSVNQEDATTIVKRNPIHRANNTNSTGHQEQRKTTTTPPFPGTETGCSDREESPQLKRLRKMEDTVTEIKERCWEARCESGVTEEDDHDADDVIADDNIHPSQAMVEQDGAREEGVQFKQHEDGSVSIRLSCSCGKSYEMLHTQNGCFYRLI